ncbi:MAG: pyruvate:ferredoxin (flavodoxin) oxidoreductase [Bacteroidetes bacterium]|nr:MAG: pyruvate:ferredoxin (flavodoxin) oxidoreductase [Bacteroidota bacterium]
MSNKKRFITCDGNYAAAHVAYMFSEVAAIYPITPSSTMAEYVDEWSAYGRKNIFGETIKVVEMQSEGGAAGAVHGSLQSGALTTTFTASQGLLLMIPNMYKMAGELLPAVFHVSARSLAAQALSIFGDHSDVMSARQTGFAILATGSVQEIMDIAPIAHFASLRSRIPFLHMFDGFRTSHEIQKVEHFEHEDLAHLFPWEDVQRFRDNALNPEHPVTRGTAQNPDIYFQAREAANRFYDPIPDMVEEYMQEITKLTGREYHPFTYYGADDAENIVVAMGSVTETIRETIDYLNANGEKTGLVSVHLYRPFSTKYFLNVVPDSVKRIAVLDRTKEPGANGEPIYLDIKELYYDKENKPLIVGGRYGLSSKDTTPAQIISVFENLKLSEPKNGFTIGIVDDVSFKSLPKLPEVSITPEGTYEAKFYGLGADGTVGANKNSIKIIGESTDKFAQAYFAYDSKKSGGITISHLRFGDNPIRATYLVGTPDFVACHVPAYLTKYDMLDGMKKGGTFLLNSIWDEEETKRRLPDHMKKTLAEKNIKLYIINATKAAREIGLGNRTNTIMQAAFFKVSEVIPYDDAEEQMKLFIKKTYGRKGEEIVNMNYLAVDSGAHVTEIKVPGEWANIDVKETKEENYDNLPDFIKNVVRPIEALKGDDLPVSAFLGREDGTFPPGTAAYEKRGIASIVPEWQQDNCIQCNQCAYVCPHAAIRPFLVSDDEEKALPDGIGLIDAKGKQKGYKYRIQVSVLDCTGCGSCADVCPSKEKSLIMKSLDSQRAEVPNWEHLIKNITFKKDVVDKFRSFKEAQFAPTLFEFSGACAGCGETPYIQTATSLYGERMMIANATGCSSIYGGSAPATPYTINEEGKGPAWANSLFEDNAEYGLGMSMGVNQMRDRIERLMNEALANGIDEERKAAFQAWIDNKENGEASKEASAQVSAVLKDKTDDLAKQLMALEQYFIKKSVWIFGGDGWAYDIGFGGVDHVIASGEDVNILVLDTEVYSNTGGQSSKATPTASVAKFATSGKEVRKKDLGAIAMTYGYVYVAQVALGGNMNQYFKALKEAEAFPGPSLIIAYSPCIAHGLRNTMAESQAEEKFAVQSGYWNLYRYDPRLEKEGKNPFQLDSKEPNWDKYQEFLDLEVRFLSLKKSFPERAKELQAYALKNAKWRYNYYKRLADMDFSDY